MIVNREAISRFVYHLQNQKIVPVWSLASEEAIYSAAVGKPAAWGPRALRLRFLLKLADKLLLADLVLLLTGAMVAAKLWWKVRKEGAGSSARGRVNRAFVGFGANSEEKLWDQYRSESDMLPIRINQSTCEGMSSLGCPSMFSIFQVLAQETLGYSARLKGVGIIPSAYRLDFLTACGMTAGIYAFHRIFWETARDSGVTEATFLAAYIPAFACVDAGISANYLQHGLISLSMLMPKFSKIEVLTDEEEKYLRFFQEDAQIIRSPNHINVTSNKKNIMLLLSVDDSEYRLMTANKIIAWANKMGIMVVVRPLPRHHKTPLVERLRSNLLDVTFDADFLTLEESIYKYKPKFVVAWTSTALATSLDNNLVPVSLCDPAFHNEIIENMVYPMHHRVLFWPRDVEIMNSIVESEQALLDSIEQLRKYSDHAFDWTQHMDQCQSQPKF